MSKPKWPRDKLDAVVELLKVHERMTSYQVGIHLGISQKEVRARATALKSRGRIREELRWYSLHVENAKKDTSPFPRPSYKTPNVGLFW